MRWYSRPYAPLVAFLIIAVVGGYALFSVAQGGKDTLYHSQIQACERGNQLRAENNRRVSAHITDTQTLQDFLIAAREARRATYDKTHEASDRDAVDEYTRLIIKLDGVKFLPVPIVDCAHTITKP